MEYGIEKYAMFIRKKKRIETMEGIELQNQKSIRTVSEKITITWGYWKRILQSETKGKKMRVSERENFSKPNSTAETS